MHFLSSILFAISVNIDNFTVGVAYGAKGIRIGFIGNLIIAAITGLGTFISMAAGLFISKTLSLKAANIIGCIILFLIGFYFIVDFFIKKYLKRSKPCSENEIIEYRDILDNPCKADIDNSGSIDMKEAVTLSIALTLNNLSLGIGASIANINIYITLIFTVVFSLLTFISGYHLGKNYLSKILGEYAPLISGIIIFILGIYEMII